jgi:hypothetical protein
MFNATEDRMARVQTPNELPQAASEALRFLNGATNPKIQVQLHKVGFSKADLDEGWTLLRAATGADLDAQPPVKHVGVLELLDEWENANYPLAEAALRRRFPEIQQALFLNLTQTEGPELVITLGALHERLVGLRANKQGREALALLAARGLDEAKIDALGALLADATSLDDAAAAQVEASQTREAARAAAVQALQDYMTEWGQMARRVITNRNHLRQLGLLSWRREPS